jgi:hypothetical protein
MRVPILSVCCAALSVAALPAAAHGWSSSAAGAGAVERNCPIVQPSQPTAYRHNPGGYHHAHGGAGCPVAQPAPAHYQYQRVFTPNGLVASQPIPDRWRQDRRAWADGNWSGQGGPGCHDPNGPQAYRDGAGGYLAAPDSGMRCHDGGMRREQAYAQASGEFGYTREMYFGRPSMTDRYGFLTWPGKTHFLRGQPVGPMGVAPNIGPQAPPEEDGQVYP